MSETYENTGLINIGQPPGIPTKFDSEVAYNNYIQTCMRVADIYPLYFELDIVELFNADKEESGTIRDDLIKTDYSRGMEEFNRKLSAIAHPSANSVHGVRVWLNSSSTAEESFSNEYDPNMITSMYDSTIRAALQANPMTIAGQNLTGKASEHGGLLSGLLDAKQISFPEVWKSTNYSPSLSLNTKLTTPYGDPESYKRNIVKPLLGLLALVSPSSTDGVTYGIPPYFSVKAYGSMNINLATMSDISISRGGAETRFNAKKQPLEIEITMSFKPALPGFAAMVDPYNSMFSLSKFLGIGSDIASYDSVSTSAGSNTTSNGSIPGIATLGSMIESLRPATHDALSTNSLTGVNIDFFGNSADEILSQTGELFTNTLVSGASNELDSVIDNIADDVLSDFVLD